MLADDEVVAVLTLESTKEDVKLAILKVNEWEVREITPVVYSYELCLPEEIRVYAGGILQEGIQEDEKTKYSFRSCIEKSAVYRGKERYI